MQDLYSQIEEYLTGRLTGEQLKTFEEKLKSDTEFAKEVQLYRELKSNISKKDLDFMTLINEVKQDFHTNNTISTDNEGPSFTSKENKTRKVFPLRYLAYAASILLLLGLGLWFFQNNDQQSLTMPALADQYYQSISTTMGESTDTEDWETRIDKLSFNDLMNIGEQYWQKEEYKKALKAFRYAKKVNNALLKAKSQFYQALCHLQLSDKTGAEKLLSKIPEKSDYTEDAKEILKKLDKIIE